MSSASLNDRIFDYLSLLDLRARRLDFSNRMMGCASSQSGNVSMNSGLDKSADDSNFTGASAEYPPAEAFEISLDDVDNDDNGRSDSLIKKHPPKRLQKLVEQAATAVPPTTIEDLEEKLAKAEVRRQQYIQQRIDNIISVTGKGGSGTSSNDGDATDDSNDRNDGSNDNGSNAGVDGETVISPSSKNTTDALHPSETAVGTKDLSQNDGSNDLENRKRNE